MVKAKDLQSTTRVEEKTFVKKGKKYNSFRCGVPLWLADGVLDIKGGDKLQWALEKGQVVVRKAKGGK